MTAVEILDELRARGAVAYRRGDEVRMRPARAITPKLLERVKAHKVELLPLLSETLPTSHEHALRVVVDAMEPLTAPIARNAWTTVSDPAKAIAADLASLERVLGLLAEARRAGARRAADLEGDVAELIARLERCGARVRVVGVAP